MTRELADVPEATPTRWDAAERAAVTRAIARVVDDGPWIGGSEVVRFEEEFAAYLGGGSVVGCGNGTDALVLAVTGLELPVGGGVLVPANDGGYAATAVRIAGLTPIPMDLDATTLAPSAQTAADAAAGRSDVVAIVATHLHGDPLDLTSLDAWRRDRGIRLIEDCAQAHGARRDGRHVGLTGDAGAFSFYPTKNLGALGDAGAVVFADAEAARHARSLAQYGWDDDRAIVLARGRNSRLDPVQAAALRARLPFLDERNERRRAVLARYRARAPHLTFLGDAQDGVAHHAVVRTTARDELAQHLAERGVRTAVHYRRVLGDMPGLDLPDIPTPVARQLADEILSVPCTPELSEHEISRVESALEVWER